MNANVSARRAALVARRWFIAAGAGVVIVVAAFAVGIEGVGGVLAIVGLICATLSAVLAGIGITLYSRRKQ